MIRLLASYWSRIIQWLRNKKRKRDQIDIILDND